MLSQVITFALHSYNRAYKSYTNHATHTNHTIRYNPADDYSLTRHLLISTLTKVCTHCKDLKMNGEEKGMYSAAGKIKLLLLENSENH
ncbi:hypothetical protein CDAR_86261 [Caerostris darwini]|uniref:Uncharacterized protein n=1 Tax=Caerostris darwini TaxID=1538125 RepID=A0AAV4NMW4_9ARAC|nr:hypothetical protein CDAR_86261 [Caerostris darwini]